MKSEILTAALLLANPINNHQYDHDVVTLFEKSPNLQEAKNCIQYMIDTENLEYIEILQNIGLRTDELGHFARKELQKIAGTSVMAAEIAKECAQNAILIGEKNFSSGNAQAEIITYEDLKHCPEIFQIAGIELEQELELKQELKQELELELELESVHEYDPLKEHNLRGLENSGQDCFMNAAIQSLSKQEWLELLDPNREIEINNYIQSHFMKGENQILTQDPRLESQYTEFQKNFQEYKRFMKDAAPVIQEWLSGASSAQAVRNALLQFITLDRDGQGDAREFVANIYDILLATYTDKFSMVQSLSSKTFARSKTSRSEPIGVFNVSVVSQYDHSKKLTGLRDVIADYLKPSTVELRWEDHDNEDKNGIDKETTSTPCFTELPQTLKLSLVREDFATGTSHNHVIQIEDITIPETTKSGIVSKTYTCASAICRNDGGSMNNGHYYTYRKVEDQWYKFDDTRVRKIDEQEALGDISASAVYVSMRETLDPTL